ncbi:acyltransferase family protein [Nocardioides sp. AN3]
MTLVTLVVIGHSWTMLASNAGNDHLYDFLYTWHMPAFVFITGYLSRGFEWTASRLWALVRSVAIPYVILEAALAMFRLWAGGEHLQNLWIDPHWPLWYLPAVFLWRLATPLLRSPWVAFPVAVAASLLGGLYTGATLDFARVLGFLPFFVLGLHASRERLDALRRVPARCAAVAAMVGIWFLSGHLRDWAGTGDWLYYNDNYHAMGASASEGYVTRMLVLGAGAVGALALLSLMTSRSGWFTRMGSMTLVVYLCHGFFIKALGYAGYSAWANAHGFVALLVTTVISVAIAFLLAWRPVATGLLRVIDPLDHAERRLQYATDLAVVAARAETDTRTDRASMHQTADREAVAAGR